jgi:hypothetical protein
MRIRLFKTLVVFSIINCFLIQETKAQDEYNLWVFGFGINAVDYFPTLNATNFPDRDPSTGNQDGFFNELTNAEDHWNIFAPRISVTRYWKSRISLDAAVSVNRIERIGDNVVEDPYTYYAIDGHLQYCLVNPENYFTPFLFAGGGYTFADKSGGTVNVGIGGNYWFTEKYGFSAQGSYKYNSPDFSLRPHVFYSFSIIIKPNAQRRYKWNARKRFNWRNGK